MYKWLIVTQHLWWRHPQKSFWIGRESEALFSCKKVNLGCFTVNRKKNAQKFRLKRKWYSNFLKNRFGYCDYLCLWPPLQKKTFAPAHTPDTLTLIYTFTANLCFSCLAATPSLLTTPPPLPHLLAVPLQSSRQIWLVPSHFVPPSILPILQCPTNWRQLNFFFMLHSISLHVLYCLLKSLFRSVQ